MPKKIDLTGQPFGRLIVIREYGRDKWGKVLWLCRCLGKNGDDCGKEVVATSGDLNSGAVKSCGCLRLDRRREVCTKHGLCASHPRLMLSVRAHIRFIRCCTDPEHKNYKHLMIPAKYLGSNGAVRFVQEVIRRYPEKADEYERNKNLELDKDISGVPVFAPWNIRFVTHEDNNNHRRNTLKIVGTPLTKVCLEEGISTRVNGRKSPEYDCISRMWRGDQKIHPILWNARKQNLEREERLLEMTKLRVRHAELMIEGLKKLTTSKSDTLDARSY